AEIKVGDNDNLSALAAILAGADKLLLLTDQQGPMINYINLPLFGVMFPFLTIQLIRKFYVME
ncbi:hypothetical protein FCI58_26905, partial [Enterobacter hormaechei]|nr:hypothetical protein [Enterobacter hormaechei]